MQRIFLVGCPRSGTTILQSLLAAHPEIISFPETKFFHYLWTDKLSDKLPRRLRDFFYKEIHRPDLYDESEIRRPYSALERIKWFIQILDRLARESNVDIWLEKTPEHIYFAQEILNVLPGAKYIHIIRNPLDTIASMRKATKDPMTNSLWRGEWSLDFCLQRWKSSALINHFFHNNPSHLLVKYEDLLQDKVKFLSKCCDFIDIEYDSAMLLYYREQAISLSLGHPWHKEIDREIKTPIASKHKDFFNSSEINYVLEQTKDLREYFGYD